VVALAGVGLLNGLAVARFQLPPIVVTLAMMSIVRGAALLVGGSVPHLQLVAKGVIIVVAIALDNFLYRWSESG